jgi:hypothetical protein
MAADIAAYLWRRVAEGGGVNERSAAVARGLVERLASVTVEVMDVLG